MKLLFGVVQKKTAMIKQFLNDVEWGELDFLIIDTPPGTSDEHITIMECMQNVKCNGAIIVTTPQQAALDDVRKELTFCKKTKIPILGIIENMSGFVCPHCSNCTNIFSSDGGKSLSEMAKVDLLGTLPIDPRIGILKGTACSALTELPDSSTAKALKEICEKITLKIN